MKKIYKKKYVTQIFIKTLNQIYSPKKILEMGVFGGSYFGLKIKIKEYPKSWFKNARLSKNLDLNLN